MYIQHNIPALNSYRNTKENRTKLEKNLERLASGYRINRASDDAAGLAISEGMRAMIHGLNQAKDNVSDGINMVRTADGAMQEIHSMLQRISTLCTASSNGTYNDDDRAIMQEEVEQLKDEIDRICESTEFNGVPLLRGVDGGGTLEVVPDSLLPAWVQKGPAFAQGHLTETYTDQKTFVYKNGNTTKHNIDHAAGSLDFSALDASNVSDLKGTGFFFTCVTCERHYSINFTDGTGSQMETSGDHYIFNIGIDGITKGSDLVKAIINGTNNGNPNSHFSNLTEDPNKPGTLIIYDNRSMGSDPTSGKGTWTGWKADFNINTTKFPNGGLCGDGVARIIPGTERGDVVLQIGDTNSDPLEVDLPNITMETLGLKDTYEEGKFSVETQELAHASMQKALKAITFISGERGRMGSYENRLEHTFNNLTNSSENITSAESRIRDTDMAEEITQYTKNNIINQSAQTMLAQANSMLNTVLSLLQQ